MKFLIATCLLALSVAFVVTTVDVSKPYAMVDFDQDATVVTLNPVCFSITTMDYGAEPEQHQPVVPTKVIYTAKQQNQNFERQQNL